MQNDISKIKNEKNLYKFFVYNFMKINILQKIYYFYYIYLEHNCI